MKIKKIVSQRSIKNFIVFDVNARVEIMLDQDELEFENDFDVIVKDQNISDDAKIILLKELLVKMAHEKMNSGELSQMGIDITAHVNLSEDVSVDRIDWQKILHPEDEELED